MTRAQHYCADCDTHFGGEPNCVTPEKHADIAHGGGMFKGVVDGDWRDWERKRSHQKNPFADIDDR
jgi:hypothetical protein